MLGIFGSPQLNVLRSDDRKMSPIGHTKLPQRKSTAINVDQSDENKVEALRSRTTALAEQHKANSRKALRDEQRVKEAEESSQPTQLSHERSA